MDGRDRLVFPGQRHLCGGKVKGQDRIIDMRRAGRAPSVGVVFDMGETMPWFDYLDSKTPGLFNVWIERGDIPACLDLRFVIGLNVCISEEDGKDWRPLADACVSARAARVFAVGRRDGDLVKLWDTEESNADHP